MGDRENQLDEVCVLESIYTDEELSVTINDEEISGHFVAYINLPDGFYITYKNFKENIMTKLSVSHLPPITLKFRLPKNYPSECMPDFEISCMWLSVKKLNLLCKRLDALWKENYGCVILYIWTQFLKEESLDYLGIGQCIDLTRKYIGELRKFGFRNQLKQQKNSVDSQYNENSKDLETSDCDTLASSTTKSDVQDTFMELKYTPESNGDSVNLKKINNNPTKETVNLEMDSRIKIQNLIGLFTHHYVVAYSEDRRKIEFLRNIHLCEICFQDKHGYKCTEFQPCLHAYCIGCIKEYFEVRIKDGMVQSMPCPHDKCTSEASQNQIKEIIGPDQYDKYDQLLLNATLNTMDDITYCPRRSCGTPVMRDGDDKMAVCSSCHYAFCVFCKMTYHGVEPCRLKAEEKRKIVEEYESGDNGAKLKLEKLYGKKQIQSMVQTYKSENWISSNSKPCPRCEANIEKSDGCNKMSCWKCKEYFCWLCLKSLDPNAPYQHYMDPSSRCHNKLFQGVDMNNDNIDMEELEDEDDDELFDLLDEFEILNERLHHIDHQFIPRFIVHARDVDGRVVEEERDLIISELQIEEDRLAREDLLLRGLLIVEAAENVLL